MIRCNLVEGDQSSANGVTLEGMPQDTINGKRMAFLGARVYCPACRTTGQIVGVGPRHPNDFMGQQEALDGDLCVCKCDPSPIMIASQNTTYHQFGPDELAAMDLDPLGAPLPRASRTSKDGLHRFDEQVQLVAPPGYEIAGMRYLIKGSDGSVNRGTVPTDGMLPRIFTSSETTYTVLWGDAAAAEDEA